MNGSIPYIPLVMRHENMQAVPALPLPAGYSLRLFRPGEESHWARITAGAGEFQSEEQALAHFQKEFGGHTDGLAERCLFLLDGLGHPVGTAMGWYLAGEPSLGRLHWVSIVPGHQGRGLAKPLVAAAMGRMAELGHREGMLTTQPGSWKGIRTYLGLGWKPYDDGHPEFHFGWELVQRLSGSVV